jgi:hypothetical protein
MVGGESFYTAYSSILLIFSLPKGITLLVLIVQKKAPSVFIPTENAPTLKQLYKLQFAG